MGPRPILYALTVKRHALKPSTSTMRNVKLRTLKFLVDEKMTFRQHTESVIGRGKNKWKELRLYCTKK